MAVQWRLSFASRLSALGCVFVVLLLAATAESAARSPALQKVIEGANKEGNLLIEWSGPRMGGHAGLTAMVNAMNKRYGTNIRISFTPGQPFPQMLHKLTQEWKAGQPASSDIYLGTSTHIATDFKTGMLRKLNWAAILERPVPPGADIDVIAAEGVAVAMSSRAVGIPYNTKLVKGDDIPKSMEDVFKPKWKGRIAAPPYATGLYQFAAADILGYEYMKNYTQRLAKHIGGLVRCSDTDRIASGEFAMLVFDCGHDDILRLKRRGAPVDHAVIKEVARINILYFGIPQHARHPNAGILLTNFLHSEEGQKLQWDYSVYDLHIYPESRVAPMLQGLRAARGKLYNETVERELKTGNIDEINRIADEFVKILQAGGR
ncbi:MAG: extracellular solute-binding protein [Deltaproteobacteria bacterium]|nr:extracellular solute-binding protein [Deltaproteobacteria bacterium]